MRSAKLLTALLVLTVSSAALAEPDSRKDRYSDRYDRYDRSDRYDRYGRYDRERVMVLAHEMENIAVSIYRQAARNNRRPDRDEARMLAALRELAEGADHFHGQVESYRRDRGHTERDFQALVDAFYFTADALRRVDRRPYVDRGMDRIAVLLSDLSRHYGVHDRYDRWSYGRGGHDRYGHDRYARPRDDRHGRGYDDHDRWDDHDRRPPR